MIYQAVRADEPLSQGDIFDGCPIFGAVEVVDAFSPEAHPHDGSFVSLSSRRHVTSPKRRRAKCWSPLFMMLRNWCRRAF